MVLPVDATPPPGRDLQGVDLLLRAFLPGKLSEIVGPGSSGSSSLLTALISRVTSDGGHVAIVDARDAFDPSSAAEAGADLARLLWVKCGGRLGAAWSATDLLTRCPAFALVACDLGEPSSGERGASALSLCRRIQRAAEQSAVTVVLRVPRPLAGSAAALVVSVPRLGAQWVGQARPTRLIGLRSEAVVLRARARSTETPREGERVAIEWRL